MTLQKWKNNILFFEHCTLLLGIVEHICVFSFKCHHFTKVLFLVFFLNRTRKLRVGTLSNFSRVNKTEPSFCSCKIHNDCPIEQ